MISHCREVFYQDRQSTSQDRVDLRLYFRLYEDGLLSGSSLFLGHSSLGFPEKAWESLYPTDLEFCT